jgi:hypothetical protein
MEPEENDVDFENEGEEGQGHYSMYSIIMNAYNTITCI